MRAFQGSNLGSKKLVIVAVRGCRTPPGSDIEAQTRLCASEVADKTVVSVRFLYRDSSPAPFARGCLDCSFRFRGLVQ